jgi:predicted ATP-dependent endonuclease of OLD family
MELRRIKYRRIYGHLSGELNFKRGENFLVGINGCGKTTVLNLIQWLLRPSFPDLCTLEHELISLDLKHGRYIYSIQSRIFKKKHELKVITKNKTKTFNPIITPLQMHPKAVREQRDLHDVRSLYYNMTPEPHEVSTWNFLLEEIPSPVFVGLERDVRERRRTITNHRVRMLSREDEGRNPIIKATELMRDAFNTGRRRLVEINEKLNREVLELSFSGVLRPNFRFGKSAANNIEQKITQLKLRFQKSSDRGAYSKALSANEVRSAVVKYLEDLESLLADSNKKDEIWVALNQHNFNRASKMFDLFEEHEKRAKSVQVEMEAFAEAVNWFLNDSNKHIHFDEDTGAPFFTSSNFDEKLSLSDLSSGEAQIVILLSYFAFLAKTGIPIVIDEPELSLHVEWQRHFVEAVKRVMPKECQTIMATHSPEICGASDVNVQAISIRSSK